MPLAVSWHYASAIIVHFSQGVLFGVAFPAAFQMWKFWAPPFEKSRLITTAICGALGLIWLILWILLTSDKPGDHIMISDKEKFYIQESIGFDGSAEI
uniref:Uncharacterized protein n=1 Tax=Romanomermis culicivorax TaxID=13658 RepID=A0A915JKY2_ROMCU